MKKTILLIATLMLYLVAYSQQNRVTDWNTDLDYLASELPEKHYNLFAIKDKSEFLSGIEEIKARHESQSDMNTVLDITRLIAGFGDSHTSPAFHLFLDKAKALPIKLYWFSDGLRIIQTNEDNKAILGGELVAVEGVHIAEVVDSLCTLITVDNRSIIKQRIPFMMSYIQILEYFGFSDGKSVEIGIKTIDGEYETCTLRPSIMDKSSRVSIQPESMPYFLKNQKLIFTAKYFPKDKIYYMLYNVCTSREIESEYGDKEKAKSMPSIKDFEAAALDALDNEKVDILVFDMRNNSGGSSRQGTQLIKKLAARLENSPQTELYVVIGRQTFSSAVLNTLDFKNLTHAVLVGEETSGKPNHFGEVREFKLPSSGMPVYYSTKYFKNTDENLDSIRPDVEIEMSFDDYLRGIDPVYEWIMAR